MDYEDIAEGSSSHGSDKTSYQDDDDNEATDDTHSFQDGDEEATDDTHSSHENEPIDESHSPQESEGGDSESSVSDNDEESDSEDHETDISQSDNDEENISNANELLIDDVLFKYANEFQELLQHYQEDDLSKKDATAAAFKALRPKYRQDLKKNFVNYISNMMEIRQTPLFRSILKKMRYFKDDGFDDKEAIKSAVNYRKYSIYNLLNSYIKNIIRQVDDDDEDSNMKLD